MTRVERIGFLMALLPAAEDEYRRAHAEVWPELLDELRKGGARNYSIFRADGQLFGYLEVDDFDTFRRHMAASEVNRRWQMVMSGLIDPMIDPRTGFHRRLEEVFHLD